MNPGPILIIINTFHTLFLALLFSSLTKSKNTKTYLLSCNHIKNPKTPLSYFISHIIALVYFIALYLFYCICYFILLTFNTLCLTTIRWSWGRKTMILFCRLPDVNKESLFNCSTRVRYMGKIYPWYNNLHL
jgi:hypothetical protein